MPKIGGMLFGAVFASVGIGMASYSVYQVYRWYDASRWTETPATIDTLKLRVNRGDGTTYGVDCQYHYNVNGRRYDGDSPSFYGGSDNFGRFQQDLHARLEKAKKTGNAKVWIDPNSPEKSVLDRTFRCGFFSFSQLFSLVFGCIGIAIFVASLFSRDPAIRNQMLKIDSASRPTRAVYFVLMFYCGALFLLGLPVALLTILNGEITSGLLCLFLTSIFGAAFVGVWRGWKKIRHIGRLELPTKDAAPSEPARIVLPAVWQGPIDMDVRWTIPRPPSNQIGVEDEHADSANVDLPAVGGTMRETHVPLPMPAIAEALTSEMPVKLEVKGTIGGYRYSDEFAIPTDMVGQLAFQTQN